MKIFNIVVLRLLVCSCANAKNIDKYYGTYGGCEPNKKVCNLEDIDGPSCPCWDANKNHWGNCGKGKIEETTEVVPYCVIHE